MSLPKCRRIIAEVDLEFARGKVMRRRATIQARQMNMENPRASFDEVRSAFSDLRAQLEALP
jgi:hypothetical protein